MKEERLEKQERPSGKQERAERSLRQSRRDRSRNRKDMEGEIVLLDEDMEFLRLDEDDPAEAKDGNSAQGEAEGER